MWAGPQCTQLLALAGCRVVKVEDPGRLDGTRRGPRAFFDLVHHGKESVVAPLRGPEVASWLAEADVVVTGARPRALRPLGLFPPAAPIWVAITGHGLEGADGEAVGSGGPASWVAFGDDAAVAAGVVARDADRADGRPLFCGDALADPVAGVLAALGALALLRDGRPGRVAVSLRDAAAQVLQLDGPPDVTPPPPGEVALPRARSLADLDAARG
jgi:crotonobetainyl-CoA:carnitine CoA-transferase CaiB-like acyl-CoA transferase